MMTSMSSEKKNLTSQNSSFSKGLQKVQMASFLPTDIQNFFK